MVGVEATSFPLLTDSPESCVCKRVESSVVQKRKQGGL